MTRPSPDPVPDPVPKTQTVENFSMADSDDVTRILSPAQAALVELADDATKIIANPLKASTSAVQQASPVTQFPVTKPLALESQNLAASAAQDNNLLAIGTRVAEFEITRLIGQGGFGVVYEAWDHTLERTVAIKEYMPTALANRQPDGSVTPISAKHKETFDVGMRSFINEARLLAQFDHPSLVKVYRFWQERGTTYMVMPCYQGITLKQALIDKRDVNEKWLLDIVDGVTQALAVMHRASCYHRDIAPDNIMLLESTGLPVVLDFGAARRVITDVTQAITVILKPGYAPIEQYSETDDMTQGAWTDVYALSAVMHVAVTGRSPPPSVARLLNDRYVALAADPELLTRFQPRILQAIDAGLGVRPESRPQSMQAFRHALGLGSLDLTVAKPSPHGALSHKAPNTSNPDKTGDAAAGKSTSKNYIKWASITIPLVLIVAAGLWWSQSSTPATTVAAGKDAASIQAAPATQATITPAVSAAPPAQVFDASRSLKDVLSGASADYAVGAKPLKAEVQIGKDKLEFQVQSNKAGFVYVYYLSTSSEMYLLFPNALDKRNKIEAGATMSLPRPSWGMEAGGPAGTDEFVVLVSERERDLKATGIQYDGVFGQFSTKILAALEVGRPAGQPLLAGAPVCEGAAPCKDLYGANSFKITEK
jgi:serine/threonine protein kinase